MMGLREAAMYCGGEREGETGRQRDRDSDMQIGRDREEEQTRDLKT